MATCWASVKSDSSREEEADILDSLQYRIAVREVNECFPLTYTVGLPLPSVARKSKPRNVLRSVKSEIFQSKRDIYVPLRVEHIQPTLYKQVRTSYI